MRIYQGFDALPAFRHPVVTIGSFDGVHRGHMALIERLNTEAQAQQGESIVLTFEPHPRVALGQDADFHLLTTTEEKARLLEEAGVDVLIIIPFDRTFAATSGAEFISRYLIGRIGAETLIAGYNHRFGHDRSEVATIASGQLKVIRVEACDWQGTRVSSTEIRRLLDAGERARAEELAGHPLSDTYYKQR